MKYNLSNFQPYFCSFLFLCFHHLFNFHFILLFLLLLLSSSWVQNGLWSWFYLRKLFPIHFIYVCIKIHGLRCVISAYCTSIKWLIKKVFCAFLGFMLNIRLYSFGKCFRRQCPNTTIHLSFFFLYIYSHFFHFINSEIRK